MGSGAFASAGLGQAAYQSRIFYIQTPVASGGGTWTSLTTSQTSRACYRLSFTPASSATGDSGSFFYFGGPGGGPC